MRTNQKGFTLIEIIAVLIILGILAAVAVPRFMDLTADARRQAANAAVAEGIARANMLIARNILSSGGTIPTAACVVEGLNASYQNAGDFSISYAGAGGGGTAGTITVSGWGVSGNVSGGDTVEKAFDMPTSN